MRTAKTSQRIVVGEVEYRWRATGNDGYISIGVGPTNNVGPYIRGTLGYHETWLDHGDGRRSSSGNQIIVINRLIRRIIEHAITAHHYDPHVKGKELNLRALEEVIRWDDAVRAVPGRETQTGLGWAGDGGMDVHCP